MERGATKEKARHDTRTHRMCFSTMCHGRKNFTHQTQSNKTLRQEIITGEQPRRMQKKGLRGVGCISSAKGVADPKISDSPKAEQVVGTTRQNTVSAE